MEGDIVVRLVIEAHCVQKGAEAVVHRVGVAAGGRDITGRILAVGNGRQFLSVGRIPALALLGDFVADAPHDHRGVVAITADQGPRILLMPLVEQVIPAVVVARLGLTPGVEHLVQDHEAHAVGKVEQFRGRRVVAGAEGIAAHLPQQLELPLEGPHVDRRAQGAQVVMIADAVELEMLAVDQQPLVGVVLHGTHAEGGLVGIDHVAVLHERGHGHIAMGRIGAPQLRIGQRAGSLDRCALSGGDLDGFGRNAGHGLASPLSVGVEREDLARHAHRRLGLGIIVHRHLQVHGRRRGAHRQRGQERAPLPHVNRRRHGQPDVAIDAAAGIPPRRVVRIVEP